MTAILKQNVYRNNTDNFNRSSKQNIIQVS